jgi:hypothetical protein
MAGCFNALSMMGGGAGAGAGAGADGFDWQNLATSAATSANNQNKSNAPGGGVDGGGLAIQELFPKENYQGIAKLLGGSGGNGTGEKFQSLMNILKILQMGQLSGQKKYGGYGGYSGINGQNNQNIG